MDSPLGEALFGGWLRRRRRALDLTQKALARRVGCSAAFIRKLEADERHPSRSIALELASALGVPAGERAAFVRFARGGWADRPPSAASLPDLERPWLTREALEGLDAAPRSRPPQWRHPLEPVRRRPEPTSQAPFIGRESQWGSALEAGGRAARGGPPEMLLVRGIAGIGKTHFAEALFDWSVKQGFAAAWSRAYSAEGRLPFGPVIDWLRSDVIAAGLVKLEPVWSMLVGRLLPELARGGEGPRDPGASPAWQRRHLFEALCHALLVAGPPRLLVLDDAQWCDPETLEWLDFLLRQEHAAGTLAVLTVRAESEPDNDALASLVAATQRDARLTRMDLEPLDRSGSLQLASAITGRELTLAEEERLLRETEGHPLFIVETLRAGFAFPEDGDGGLRDGVGPRSLPPRMRAVLSARLAQLSPEARELAGLGAAIGRGFSFELLRLASGWPEDRLIEALDELWARRIFGRETEGYDFTHDRLREVGYDELTPARRTLLHRHVAQAIERLGRADLDSMSASLAAHFEMGDLPVEARTYYTRAARSAAAVCAHEEAIRLFRKALSIADRDGPERDRGRRELALRLELSASVSLVRGYASPELEEALEGALALAQALEDGVGITQGLIGLWGVRVVRRDLQDALRLAEAALEACPKGTEPTLLAECRFALGGMCQLGGDLAEAHQHFLEAKALLHGHDDFHPTVFGNGLLVFAGAWEAHVHCLENDGELARACVSAAIARADRLKHHESRVLAHAYAGLIEQMLGDPEAAIVHAGMVEALCREYGVAYYGVWAHVLHGWKASVDGDSASGITQIRDALLALDGLGAGLRKPYYLSLLAESYLRVGRTEDAASALDVAIRTAEDRQEVWWLPELRRLRSLVAEPADVSTELEQALHAAQRQGNRLLERRILRSLGSAGG